MEHRQTLAGHLLLAAGIALAGFFVGRGLTSIKAFERAVEVRGFDERVVQSDIASWRLNYLVTGATTEQVKEEVLRAQQGIEQFLLETGFAREEIQRQPINLADQQAEAYRQNLAGPRYVARGSTAVNTDKVALAQQAAERTDELLKKGIVLSNSQLRFFFTKLNTIKPEMLKAATANAREAALTFAKDAGARLGRLRSASQGLFTIESPFEQYDEGSSITKKVRVVARAWYFLE